MRVLEGCHNLSDIERRLRAHLPNVTLLGQIPLEDEDFQLLRQVIKDEMQESFSRIAQSGRLAFACFLVRAGIKHYDHGTYWAAVEEDLEQAGEHLHQRWGQTFLGTLEQYRLTVFTNQGGLTYVTPILLHGGIPDNCLPDFFERVLDPIVNDRQDIEFSDAEQLIAEWLGAPQYQDAKKPVQRFLSDGGKPAADFLSRCLEMARAARGHETIPPTDELGLPERVVQRFEQWRRRSSQQPLLLERQPRMKRPQIERDWYGEVFCVLPEQSLVKDRNASFVFQVFADDRSVHQEELSGYFTANHFVAERTECRLSPARNYRVCLLKNVQSLREWTFAGVRDEGWLAFDERGALIHAGQLPRARFQLVFLDELSLDPALRVIEESPGTDQWSAYRGCLIDAEEIESLALIKADGQRIELPLASGKEPALCGEPAAYCRAGELPVYTDNLPAIRVPIAQEEITHWDVIVEDLTGTTVRRKHCALKDVVGETENDWAIAPLAHPDLLGEPLLGEYRVKLRSRGVLGYDKQFQFAFVRDLRGEFARPFYLANEKPRLTLLVNPSLELTAEESAVEIRRQDEIVEVVGGTNDRTLILKFRETGDRALSLDFAVPRLRWAVRGLANHLSSGWLSEALEAQREDFEASAEITLVVQSPLENGAECALELEGANQRSRARVRNGETRFSLSQFSDSLLNLSAPLAKFVLRFAVPPHGEQKVCLLTARTRWVVEGFESRDLRTVAFRWKDQGPLRDRRFRLWNLLQPWQPPREFSVPDGVSEIEISESVSTLPAGQYRIEMFLAGEFEPAALPPCCNEADVFDLTLGEAEMAGGLLSPTPSFRRCLMRRLAGYEDNFDLSDYALTEADLDDLTRVLIFLIVEARGQEARHLWFNDLRRQIGEPAVRDALRKRINDFAGRSNDRAEGQLLTLCKTIGLAVESLLPFQVNAKVVFENRLAAYGGIAKGESFNRQERPEDMIYLEYRSSKTRRVPLSRLSEMHLAPSDATLSEL